jgi:beta-carotene hydroxylase
LRFTREHSIWVSRFFIVLVLGSSLSSYFWTPQGPLEWAIDLALRTYLHFVAGALAHEGTHGHLGNSRAANDWWGRLAVTTALVPWITFKKTHLSHHAHTNVPGRDPDEFLHSPKPWQVPLRILAMPHQWFFWLRRQGKVNRAVLVELLFTYAAYLALYGTLAVLVGPARLLASALGAAFLHSFLLWIPFAMKTHEGYSTGAAEERSHNYFGYLPFFFSFGLSLHRVHHLKPKLSWLEMLPHVERGTLWQSLTFRRDTGRYTCRPA